jgi:HK97 family phage prohead protease
LSKLSRTAKVRKHAPRRVDLNSYGRRLRSGSPPDVQSLSACLAISDVESKEDGGTKSYTFTISTSVIDRDRDVIAVDGWHTDAYMAAGGPVLFGHGYDANGTLPIGKATKVWATKGALKASMVFLAGDPFAERVQRAVDFGALRATSVGFRPYPGRAAWNEERNGIDFLEQELLEFSIVPVPANPEALREKTLLVTSDPPIFVLYAEALNKALELSRALGKRGRVLSSANEERIRAAHGHGEELVTALSEVIAQVSTYDDEEDEDEKTIGAHVVAVDPVVVRILPDPAPRFALTAADVRSATVAALTELVAAEVRRHTGRLD